MLEPIFHNPIKEIVVNHKTQNAFYLTSLDSHFEDSQNVLEQIVEICNEPEIYRFLFKIRLKGLPYPIQNAQTFVQWAKTGWSNREWFVFLVMTDDNQVAGALDIRGNNLDGSEIGYWLSSKFSGVMTNAIAKLLTTAKQAGYKKLFAWVNPTNGKSSRVLVRSGFAKTGLLEKDHRQLYRYEITLD